MKLTKKMMILCCALLYGGGLAGCAATQTEFVEAPPSAVCSLSGLTEADGKDGADPPEELFVYVCGEVKRPGVYRLSDGARVYEALEEAGGLTEAAEDTALNQARLLEDVEEIRVPAKGEVVKPQTDEVSREDKININTADAAQLMTLNGIGEAKAAAILAYREENGRFSDISEIKNVRGIGESVYAGIQDKIKVT